MDEHDYVYLIRPLIIPGLLFLILFPVVVGVVHVIRNLPGLELKILIAIYVITGLGIFATWVIGKTKHVQILDHNIVFGSILGKHVLGPEDIRRVAFYFDNKGQEIAQIRSRSKLFYVSECYFPFPELMSDLEKFILRYDIRSNLNSYTGLNQ